MQIVTNAPPARLAADRARRTITGLVVPWGTFAQVSTGQTVGFARGSLALSERAKLVLDHDPAQPVAVYVSSTDTEAGLEATFKVPAGPRGDAVLADAGDGLRDGLSVAADLRNFDERDDGSIWVTNARGRHVALLSEPAYDTARVSAVAATAPQPPPTPIGALPVTVTASTPTEPAPDPEPEPEPEPDNGIRLTVAGAAQPVRPPSSPARVRDPYPYSQPHIMGGPSFVRDAWAAMETPGTDAGDRWRRATAMRDDPGYQRAALAALAAAARPELEAASGTSGDHPGLFTPHYRPDRFVPLVAAKAPLWSVLTKYPTPDFNPIMVPRTTGEAGLSGKPADEITPIAPGDITTDVDTIAPEEVEGAYMFSRKLLMGSNPQIDAIALNAMDRAWVADMENRAATFFNLPANHTAVAATYADAGEYLDALQAQMADMATSPFTPTDLVPARIEFTTLATAKDSTGRPLLPEGPRLNAAGESTPGYTALLVQGIPLWPGRSIAANKTLVLDQSADSAVAWVTPVMNFRLEWTSDATGGNVKVLKLVKYSGVGLWTQYREGVVCMTNTTPLTAAADAEPAGRAAKKA